MFAVQFIHGRPTPGVDPADLPWESIPGHGDYPTLEAAWAAADEFDAAFDAGSYTHRAVQVANDNEEA